MENTLFQWILNFTREISNVGNWLITPLDYLNISPLGLFTVSGLSIVVGWHVVRLLIGG